MLRPGEVIARYGSVDEPFALASVSKVLSAIVVHIALEEGTIGLDDPAGPDGSTVRHLLAHASGLPPDGDRTPLGPPQRKRIYSNVGFEILAEHLEPDVGVDALAPGPTQRGSLAVGRQTTGVGQEVTDGAALGPGGIAEGDGALLHGDVHGDGGQHLRHRGQRERVVDVTPLLEDAVGAGDRGGDGADVPAVDLLECAQEASQIIECSASPVRSCTGSVLSMCPMRPR